MNAVPRHRRVIAGMLAAVAVAGPARPAQALFGEENWLSGENEILIAQLVAQLKSLTELTTVVTNITQLVRTANQTLALARWVRRTYEMVAHYRWSDLVEDARRGLYAAMPEAEALAQEIDELGRNGRTLGRGRGFFKRYSPTDAQTRPAARAAFSLAYRSALWPAIFPRAFEEEEARGGAVTPVDQLIFDRYQRTQMDVRKSVQDAAFSAMSQRLSRLTEAAERSENLPARAVASNAQLNLQTAINTTRQLNLTRQDVGLRAWTRSQEEAFRRRVAEGLGHWGRWMVLPPGQTVGVSP